MDNYEINNKTWDEVAWKYQDKFMDIDLYNDGYDLFCELQGKPHSKILEVGCGPGNITKYLLTKRPDLVIEGIDVAPNMIDLARINNPAASFAVMDCRDISRLSPGFDAIMCGFCLPYLTKDDSITFIQHCSLLLNAGGIFYFSVIEDDYSNSTYETSSDGQHRMFVYYHEESYLSEALLANNFELLALQRKSYPKAAGKNSVHLIFIARKL